MSLLTVLLKNGTQCYINLVIWWLFPSDVMQEVQMLL